MEQNKGRTALAMGVIMMILGAAALVISFMHPRALPEPARITTTTLAAVSSAQPLDQRAEELARQLKAAQEKLAADEARLGIERGANEGIRKEINDMRLAKQDIEARLQGVTAERDLEKKNAAAARSEMDKAKADLAKLQAESKAAATKAGEELASAKTEAQAEIAKVTAASKTELDKAKADAAAQLAQLKADLDKMAAENAQLKGPAKPTAPAGAKP